MAAQSDFYLLAFKDVELILIALNSFWKSKVVFKKILSFSDIIVVSSLPQVSRACGLVVASQQA